MGQGHGQKRNERSFYFADIGGDPQAAVATFF
jgi:hypothetical protein